MRRTFYPLWAGLATPEQAKAVAKNVADLERPGGLAMSTVETGAQWDLPYGWGNIEMLCVEGLRKYGFSADADRISYEFLSMVAENFRRDGNIREKYNVVTRSSEAHAEMGYQMNVIGFGWTNAAFLELLHALPKDMVERLAKRTGSASAGGGEISAAYFYFELAYFESDLVCSCSANFNSFSASSFFPMSRYAWPSR